MVFSHRSALIIASLPPPWPLFMSTTPRFPSRIASSIASMTETR